MPSIFAIVESDQRTAVEQRLDHRPKPSRYFGLVDKSRGPSKKPSRPRKSSPQAFEAPFPFCSRSRISRTTWDCVRRSNLDLLNSHWASGSGNLTEIVFMEKRV